MATMPTGLFRRASTGVRSSRFLSAPVYEPRYTGLAISTASAVGDLSDDARAVIAELIERPAVGEADAVIGEVHERRLAPGLRARQLQRQLDGAVEASRRRHAPDDGDEPGRAARSIAAVPDARGFVDEAHLIA